MIYSRPARITCVDSANENWHQFRLMSVQNLRDPLTFTKSSVISTQAFSVNLQRYTAGYFYIVSTFLQGSPPHLQIQRRANHPSLYLSAKYTRTTLHL
jgi:hypothetical protein